MLTGTLAIPTRRLAGVACLLALLAACKPSVEEVIAQHRPTVQAVYDQLESLDAAVRAAPPVAEDGFDLGGERILLKGPASNAVFIHADHLASPESATADPTGATHALTLRYCGEFMRGDYSGPSLGAGLFLEECGRAEYAFVLRALREQPPVVTGHRSFEVGQYEGDVLLFRLSDGALLGGFRVEASNTEQIEIEIDASGNAIDPENRLKGDFSANVYSTINTKLTPFLPDPP